MKLTKTQLKRSCDICKQRPAPYWIGCITILLSLIPNVACNVLGLLISIPSSLAIVLIHESLRELQEERSGEEKMNRQDPANLCFDCNEFILKFSRTYMVHNNLWEKFGVGKRNLCPNCFGERMGRPIEKNDLIECEINEDFIKAGGLGFSEESEQEYLRNLRKEVEELKTKKRELIGDNKIEMHFCCKENIGKYVPGARFEIHRVCPVCWEATKVLNDGLPGGCSGADKKTLEEFQKALKDLNKLNYHDKLLHDEWSKNYRDWIKQRRRKWKKENNKQT